MEDNAPKVTVADSFLKVSELAAEVGKEVKMSGRIDPTLLAQTMQEATRVNLDYRNDLLEAMGEEPGIDPIDAGERLVVAYRKKLDAAGAEYDSPEAFKLRTPYWAYLKKIANQL